MERLKRVDCSLHLFVWIVRLLTVLTSDAQPTTITAIEGSSTLLPCEYSHTSRNPPLSVIEWLREGKQVPVFIKIGRYSPHIDESFQGRMLVAKRSADLRIERVVAEDEGWYECRVIFLNSESIRRQNLEGQDNAPFVNGTWVKLIVTAPPSFKLKPPLESIKREGEVLLLRCEANGRPAPVLTWLKDGHRMWNGQDGIMMSEGQLAISNVTKHHGGKYTCRAQNVVDRIEASTTVHIQAAPTLVTPPHDTTVRDGQQVMFSCEAKGYPRDIQYHWFYHGLPIELADNMVHRYVTSDGTVTFDAEVEDAGIIGCRASNGYGKSPIANATLTVKFPARVREMPPVMYGGLGLPAILPCPADAVPPVTIVTWLKEGEKLSIDKDERLSLGENGSLVINPVKESDSSHYSCKPYNILGTQGKSTEFSLIVYNAPKFVRKPNDRYQAEIGKSLTMTCNGTGDPPLSISWVKIDTSGKEVPVSTDDDRMSSHDGNLTIDNVVKSDHGKWQCILSNPVTKVRADTMVYVKYTTPHTVTNVRVVTSKYNAQISWKAGYDGGYPQDFIIWYKRADMGSHSWQTYRAVGYRKVATVSNLEPDTIYQFAILPENVVGSGQFSKEVTATTKGVVNAVPEGEQPRIEPPGRVNSHVNSDGYLLLMWQPPLDSKREELLGYIIESRRLLVDEEDENDAEGEVVLHEDETSVFHTPNTETDARENPLRSRRSLKHWNELVGQRVKRNTQSTLPSEIATEKMQPPRWTDWETLTRLQANSTEFIIPGDQLYRDQLYEFHVIAVSIVVFSSPSAAIVVSTKGLSIYPPFVGPSHVTAAEAASSGLIGVIVAAVIVVVIATVLIATWCIRKTRRASSAQFGDKEKLDRRSRNSDSSTLDEARTSTGKSGKRNGSFFKSKKKKVDVQTGHHAYSNTDELVGLTRDVSDAGKSESEVHTDGKGSTIVRRISRAPDGKFRVTDRVTESDNSISVMGSPTKRQIYENRPHSAEWDTRAPSLQEKPDESLEIDCSHSNIEVRFIKDGRGKGSCQSLATSNLSGPQQYNLMRRQVGPCDKSFDSSIGDASFQSGDYRRPPHPRHNMSLPVQRGQYVNMRNSTSHGGRNPEHRISSPPHFSDYNLPPGTPSKYKYQNHPERIRSPHHPMPRDSYSTPVEGLVYDPRYTRIEPIYEVGPYKHHKPPNRHSSFVIDTRRELPNHPYPYRAIQICSRATSVPTEPNDRSSYPTPKWRDASEPQYHTMPHQSNGSTSNSASRINPHDVELSLKRHSENAASSRKTDANVSSLTTNSLGRPRKKNDGNSRRRRVQSMDDLTYDALALEDATSNPAPTGSVDLLSPKREKNFNSAGVKGRQDISLAIQDRTAVGFDGGDEASDITIFSSSDYSSRMSNIAGLPRDLGKGSEYNKAALSSPREDDSSAVSSLIHPALRGAEITSSGYDSHNTSHASADSPALSLPLCSSSNVAMRPSPHDHDRASTASSSDRSRKDTSSVDEKYEWDSEYAMESEILEALRNFGNNSRTGSVSQALVDEIRKLGVDKVKDMDKEQFADLEEAVKSRNRSSSGEDSDRSTTVDTSDMYTKESMERRCAALRQEYQRYKMEQIQTSNPTVRETRISSTPANA